MKILHQEEKKNYKKNGDIQKIKTLIREKDLVKMVKLLVKKLMKIKQVFMDYLMKKERKMLV